MEEKEMDMVMVEQVVRFVFCILFFDYWVNETGWMHGRNRDGCGNSKASRFCNSGLLCSLRYALLQYSFFFSFFLVFGSLESTDTCKANRYPQRNRNKNKISE